MSVGVPPVKLPGVILQRAEPGRGGPVASLLIFFTLAAVVCGMTMLFLGMRSVMEVGGSCGSGGPYVYVRPCPSGVPLAMIGGIWGGVAAFLAYLYLTFRYGVPSWIWLAWPALFLSLGWNFVEFGFDPPGGGLEWGWIVCGVLFAVMGGGPLLLFGKPILKGILPLPSPHTGDIYRSPARRDRVPGSGPLRDFRSATSPRDEESGPVGLLQVPRNEAQQTDRRTVDTMGGDDESDTHVVAALERLSALRLAGSLTDEEFSAARRKVLEDDA